LALEIPLPPLAEQRRIAAILDHADALRAKRRAAIAKLDSLAQAIFLEMFGDLRTNPKKHVLLSLGSVCTRVTDGTHQPPKWSDDGVPFLFVSNIRDGAISFATEKFVSIETYKELTRRCPIELYDILYTTVGSYGNAALVRDERPFAFQRHIAHIKPNYSEFDPHFFAAMLQSPSIRSQADSLARGVAQKTLNLSDLKAFTVMKPPLEQQRAFAFRMSTLEELKSGALKSARAHETLFSAVQHRAFQGDL
jgi:type I restriction enzyme S subunit